MKIRNAFGGTEQVRCMILRRIITAQDYSPEKLDRVFGQFLEWLKQVSDHDLYEVEINEAIEAYLDEKTPSQFAADAAQQQGRAVA